MNDTGQKSGKGRMAPDIRYNDSTSQALQVIGNNKIWHSKNMAPLH